MKKNIIAICGTKMSGKTTLIKMIKRILLHKFETFDDFKYRSPDYLQNTYVDNIIDNLQVLNFADSLKEQIIALTGCTIRDLESQEFKNSLSPLYDNTFRANTIIPKVRGLVFFTYRDLHLFISDKTKDMFGKQIYVDSLFMKYNPSKHLIIGDLRYSKNTPEDEEGEIKKRGGIIVKLTRPGLEGDFSHSSESSIKDIEADIEHENIELEDLFNLAKEIVNKYLK